MRKRREILERNSHSAEHILPGSFIEFFKNGKSQGIAFKDLFEASYYPSVSLYMGCKVRLIPGPSFKFPEASIASFKSCQPICKALINSDANGSVDDDGRGTPSKGRESAKQL